MEVLRSCETSVLTGATRRNIRENAILHSHRRVNLKSYIAAFVSYVQGFHTKIIVGTASGQQNTTTIRLLNYTHVRASSAFVFVLELRKS
jgi:hypothetical protein